MPNDPRSPELSGAASSMEGVVGNVQIALGGLPIAEVDALRDITARAEDILQAVADRSGALEIAGALATLASAAERALRIALEEALATLPEVHQKVLRARYGFDGEAPTHLRLAGEIGKTRSRIQQIEAEALRRLAKTHPHLITFLRTEGFS